MLRRTIESILRPVVRVLNDTGDALAGAVTDPMRHLERVQRQIGGHLRHGSPAHATAGERVGAERREPPFLTTSTHRCSRTPRTRSAGLRGTPASHGPPPAVRRHRAACDELLASANAPQSLLMHESFGSVTGNDDTSPGRQSPDLAGAVDLVAGLAVSKHPLNLDYRLGLGHGSRRGGALHEGVVNGRSDLHPCSESTRQIRSTANRSR